MAVESTGIPFPGETMLVTAAIYAGAGHLTIGWVIVAAAGGAIFGDNCGYLLGRWGGRPLVMRYGKYIGLDAAKLDIAERFFETQGDKTVFFGRFIALLRAWAAFLAGVNRMRWPKFLLFNAAGGICWATLYGLLAFKLGQNFDRIRGVIGVVGVAIVVLLAIAIFLLRRRVMRYIMGTDSDKATVPSDSA